MKWSIPERVIEQGREYVAEKRVLSVNSFLDKKIWSAEVMGSDIFHVELDGSTKEDDFCECLYWKNHGYCKHTVAVELELRDRKISRVMTAENAKQVAVDSPNPGQELTESFTRIFLNENRKKTTVSKQKQSLKLEYRVEIKPMTTALIRSSFDVFALSLKAGIDKMYIVKDLPLFLESFIKKETIELKSGQEINFKDISIEQEDSEILADLYKQHRSIQLISGEHKDAKSLLTNNRYLVLMTALAEETIQKLQDSGNLQFAAKTITYKSMMFVEEKMPFSFDISQKSGTVTLSITSLADSHLKEYDWFVSDNIVFKPSLEQMRAYRPLQQFLQRYDGDNITIESADMPDFTAYVMPLLVKIGNVSIDDQLKESFVQEPLLTSVYFEYHDEAVHATVEFNYKYMILSTDPSKNQLPEEGVQIIRDSEKEMKIINQLTGFDYHRTETNYTKRMVRDDEFYTLFTKEIPTLELDATVYVDDLLDSMFLNQIDPETIIDVQKEGSFLDVRFDIKGITPEEVDDVLKSLMEKKAFHKFDNGTILSLESESFKQVSDVLNELRVTKKFQNGGIQLPSYRGLELNEKFSMDEKTKGTVSKKFKNLIHDLNFPEEFEVDVPKSLNAELRLYQKTGFQWLKMLSKYGFGGILADDMGLGKTIQVITYMLSEIEEKGQNDPFLIVAPASLIYNWHYEIEKFAPSIESIVISGTAEERMQLIENVKPNQVLITSYPSFRQDVIHYKRFAFSTLILDESQMVKNHNTKTSQALRDLTIKKRFALSGTPIENKIEELWAIFQLIMPGFFPSVKKFKTLPNEQIAKMIRPFVLRRIKKDVLKELPDKIETNLYSQMTKEQKTVYLAYLQRIQESVNSMNGAEFKKNRIEILAGLTRLRQICCDPKLFIDDYEGDSGKLEQLKETVQTARENGRRILIFSQFTSMLAIIEKELAEQKVETFYLSGQTKPKERIEMVNRFNAGEKDVFLISLKAGGTGLNLTGADMVILYDLWWNPAVEEQAAGRAHRIGQKKVVQVLRLIAEGTIEEKIDQLQQEKKALFDQIITEDGSIQKEASQLSEDDIREILNIGM
ncbi:SNF2 helicase associated domain-containing protein [Carnobacterium alterfunditum]|uniref:SNF2 helicase associated domain-containing protein n=1 Tax=Carnobacterium alterfunditum TaxID=28230 RepID=UPI00359402C3